MSILQSYTLIACPSLQQIRPTTSSNRPIDSLLNPAATAGLEAMDSPTNPDPAPVARALLG